MQHLGHVSPFQTDYMWNLFGPRSCFSTRGHVFHKKFFTSSSKNKQCSFRTAKRSADEAQSLLRNNCFRHFLVWLQTAASPSSTMPPSAPSTMNAIVIGGSSGMGKAAAIAVVKRGGRALIVSRSEEKLQNAKCDILSHVPQRITGEQSSDDCVV